MSHQMQPEQWRQLDCLAMLDWLDEHMRELTLGRMRRDIGAAELTEGWVDLLVYVWRHRITGMKFPTYASLERFCVGITRAAIKSRYLMHIRKTCGEGKHWVSVVCIDVMTEEDEPSYDPHKPELGSSRIDIGPMLESLTQNQREAIQATVMGRMNEADYCEAVGKSPGSVQSARAVGMKKLCKMNGVPYVNRYIGKKTRTAAGA